MATWITHLRIAEKLLEEIPDLDPHQFAIGNIGPDSGLPDENWENFDPPKDITHYLLEGFRPVYRIQDFKFYKEYLKAETWLNENAGRFSFLLGYFFHLIVDNLWVLDIWRPTKDKYLSQFEDKLVLGQEIKKDWYGIDHAYVRGHPDSFFWKIFLDSQYTDQFLEYFPNEAIPKQLDYIKNFYQRTDDDIEKEYRLTNNIYLTEQEVNKFVEDTTNTLLQLYEMIWIKNLKLNVKNSVLESLGKN